MQPESILGKGESILIISLYTHSVYLLFTDFDFFIDFQFSFVRSLESFLYNILPFFIALSPLTSLMCASI